MSSRTLVALLLCAAVACADAAAPYLAVDAGGHTGAILEMAFSADGSRLVTASADRTARVWNCVDGDLLSTIRLPASQPKAVPWPAQTMALSDDGRLLAALLTEPYNELWVWDTSSGALVLRKPLPGAQGSGLTFAADGKRLARYRDDKIEVFGIPDGRLQQTVAVTGAWIFIARWSPRGDSIAVWVGNGEGVAVRLVSLVGGSSPAAPVRPQVWGHGLAWTPDGRALLSVAYNQPFGVVHDIERLGAGQQLTGADRIDAAVYSADGSSLWTVGWSVEDGSTAAVQERDATTLAVRRLLPAKCLGATCLALRGQRLAVGAQDGEVTLWDATTTRNLRRWRSRGQVVWHAGWSLDGQQVAWSNDGQNSGLDPQPALTRAFDLGRWAPQAPGVAQWLRPVVKTDQNSLARDADEMRRNGLMILQRQGLPAVEINLTRWGGLNRFSLLPDGRSIAATLGGVVLFDQLGKTVRMFRAGTGDCYGLAVSPDDRYVLSGGDDQTLRIWPLDGPGKEVPPLLSIFVSDQGDWIAWTPEGYYACSPAAERWLSWQQDFPDKVPVLLPVYQFRERYYRPDVIALVLKHGDVAKAVAEADTQRGKPGATVVVANPATVLAPPAVTVLAPKAGALVTTGEVDLRARIADPGGRAIKAVHFTVNGRGVDGARFVFVPVRDEPGVWATRAPLVPGENILAVVASNDAGIESLPASVTVTCQPADEGPPPSLYVLAVGVAKYAKPEYNLKYADADATALAETWQAHSDKLYAKVGAKVLTNEQATRAAVLDGLDWLSREVTQRDLAVVFLAGHGVPDQRNDYHFLPYDADAGKLISTGVKWSDIRAVLARLPGRVILALDTCHSAGATGARAIGPRLDYTNLLREAATDEVGLVTLSSCMPQEVSLEDEAWQHGAFTAAMVEALGGKADANQDGIVSLAETDAYVAERVKALTGGRQHPTSQRPATIRSSLPLTLCGPVDRGR